jgi:Zn-dependent protease
MLKLRLFGIPVAVESWFWLTAALLGGGAYARDPEDWVRVGIWIAVVFVSILVHELGHAAAGQFYGAAPAIRLHGFGGVTFLPGGRFTRSQNILVSAAGPAAGFGLGVLILALHQIVSGLPRNLELAVRFGLEVNFGWTLVNLLPIQPLDGGQILGQILGPSRDRLASWIGFIVAASLCVYTFMIGLLFSALMLALLAYYNFRREPVEGGVVTP